MDLGLTEKRVMVTGATRGIGEQVARIFAEEGARVAITYNSAADKAKRLVEELGGPEKAHAVHYDLRDPKSVRDAVGSVDERFGGVDVLVANAHWFTWGEARTSFEDMSPDGEGGWANKMRANVEGQMLTVQGVVKGMRARGWGRIVLLSSVTARNGLVGSEYYSAARSAMHGFVRGLMWSRNGVLANVVAPGATRTESFEHALAEVPGTSEMVAQEIEKTPSGRLSTPEDVARLIVFLGSAANGNINGEVIYTAGGR